MGTSGTPVGHWGHGWWTEDTGDRGGWPWGHTCHPPGAAPHLSQFVQFDIGLQLPKADLGLRGGGRHYWEHWERPPTPPHPHWSLLVRTSTHQGVLLGGTGGHWERHRERGTSAHTGFYWSILGCGRLQQWPKRHCGGKWGDPGWSHQLSLLSHTGPHWLLLVHTCLYWSILGHSRQQLRGHRRGTGGPGGGVTGCCRFPVLAHTDLYWSIMARTSPYWFILVRTGTHQRDAAQAAAEGAGGAQPVQRPLGQAGVGWQRQPLVDVLGGEDE